MQQSAFLRHPIVEVVYWILSLQIVLAFEMGTGRRLLFEPSLIGWFIVGIAVLLSRRLCLL